MSRFRFVLASAAVAALAVAAAPAWALLPLFPTDAVAAGGDHSCAIDAGGVWCWGSNLSGELGDGTTVSHPGAVQVLGLSGVTAIATGSSHTCALTTGGGVKCWGANDANQLGLPLVLASPGGASVPPDHIPVPVDVLGLTSGIVAITAGDRHSCALTATGTVLCWGSNDRGQLGTGSQLGISGGPMSVVGGVASIAAGFDFTCAVTTAGALKCWGSNDAGQLGDGTNTQRNAPIDVPGLASGVAKVAAGIGQACALMTTGGVKCWGNGGFVSGFPEPPPRTTPVDIAISGPAVDVAVGGNFACAVLASGTAQCWGDGGLGQLGNLATQDRSDPVDVQSAFGVPINATQISAGFNHACLQQPGIEPLCWGSDRIGQVGDNGEGLAQPGAVGVSVLSPAFDNGRLGVIATRDFVNAQSPLIGGFIIGGPFAPGDPGMTVVIRARGPSLAASGLTNVLAHPRLRLMLGSSALDVDAGWLNSAAAATILRWGYAPGDPGDSVIIATLRPGAYTAIVDSADGGAGNAIVEIFQIDRTDIPLVNLSSRGLVLTGNDVMIAGFIVQGSHARTVAVTATGPSLAAFGIANPLALPNLTLVRSSDGAVIAANAGWQSAPNAAQIAAAGFAPADPNEAAAMMTLDPGAYTAIVTGGGGTTGTSVVGVFIQ